MDNGHNDDMTMTETTRGTGPTADAGVNVTANEHDGMMTTTLPKHDTGPKSTTVQAAAMK